MSKNSNFINKLSSQTHRSYSLIENSLSNGSTWVGASSLFPWVAKHIQFPKLCVDLEYQRMDNIQEVNIPSKVNV